MPSLEEYQHVEIAIELDKGLAVDAVAEQFGVSSHYIRKVAVAAGLIPPEKKKTTIKKRLSDEDRQHLLVRIRDGEEIESISLEFNISVATIRQWCKKAGVLVPRPLKALSKKEWGEIEELLAGKETPHEIARAFNLSLNAVEQLLEDDYKELDVEVLGFLYETLLDNPSVTPPVIKRLARKAGIELNGSMIFSYQNRLRRLERIDCREL